MASTNAATSANAASTNTATSTKKVCLLIDSRDRDARAFPTPASYTVTLPETFYDVTCARLMSAELPTSFYVFTAARGNTSFTLVRNSVPITVTIPDGNYGLTDMVIALKTALSAAAGVSIDVDVSRTSYTCTIASPDSPTDVLAVDTTTVPLSAGATEWGLAYYLGFGRDVVVQGTGSVTSPRLCTMSPELYVVLDIEELGTMVESGIEGRGGTMSRRAFAKIPINANSFEYAYFDKQITAHAYKVPIAALTKLRLQWRFHTGEPIDFHGVEHSLTIELECADVRRPYA